MPYLMPTGISDEDRRRVEEYALGKILEVHFLKAGHILMLRQLGRILGILSLLLFFGGFAGYAFRHSQFLAGASLSDGDAFTLLINTMLGVVGLLFTGHVLFFGVPESANRRLLLCEHGLLELNKRVRNTSATVIRWENVLACKQNLFPAKSCYLVVRSTGSFTLDTTYQDYEALLALARRKIEEKE